MKITIRKSPTSTKLAAFASVETEEGIIIPGFRISEQDPGQVVIYPPSEMRKKEYVASIGFSSQKQKLLCYETIRQEYEKWKEGGNEKIDESAQKEPKEQSPPPVTAIKQNILFHFLRRHKNELTALRLWFVARNILDTKGEGTVRIEDLMKLCAIDKKYLKRVCKNSELFYGFGPSKVYYAAMEKIILNHKLDSYAGKIRKEKVTKKFANSFKSKQAFEGYICKCYMENDLNPKHKYRITKGRISYEAMAKALQISRRTAIYCIRVSGAKIGSNIKTLNHTFESQNIFRNWLLLNMDKVINGHRISENPKSYFARKRKNGPYVLIQVLPNIYDFTGYSLVNVKKKRKKRGKSK